MLLQVYLVFLESVDILRSRNSHVALLEQVTLNTLLNQLNIPCNGSHSAQASVLWGVEVLNSSVP